MPNIVSSDAEVIISGILPIHMMKDYMSPIKLILSLIPHHVLQSQYSILISKYKETEDSDRMPTAEEFLHAYGCKTTFLK